MINIAYCPDCIPKMVVASNMGGATCFHEDPVEHICVIVEVDEVQPTEYPHTTADSTVVNDPDEWLAYLGKYIP